MGYIVSEITRVLTILFVLSVVVLVVGAIYFLMTRKQRAAKRIKEDATNYSDFKRMDTRDYVPYDDIRDDMIIADGGRRFIAVLKCIGYDYFYESAERQLQTISGMYSFTNTIDKPMMYRQYSKSVDLEYTNKRYVEARQQRIQELSRVQEDLAEMRANLSRDKDKLSKRDIMLYEREIRAAEKREAALQFRRFHLEDQLLALDRFSGVNVAPEQVQTWVYDCTFNERDFRYELSQEDIYYRAIKELYTIGRTKIRALQNCGVRAFRCSTDELIDMCRRYSAPKSSEQFKLSDLKDSSFFDDITGDEPLERARKRAREEIAQMERAELERVSVEFGAALIKGKTEQKPGEKKAEPDVNAVQKAGSKEVQQQILHPEEELAVKAPVAKAKGDASSNSPVTAKMSNVNRKTIADRARNKQKNSDVFDDLISDEE